MRSLSENTRALYVASTLLVMFYIVGYSGLSDPLGDRYAEFLSLTPLNLVMTTAVLLLFHRDWSATFVFSAFVVALTGFLVEVAGVHTGLIFGEYAYGAALGFKLFDVPLTIGLNWFLLVYAVSAVLDRIRNTVVFALTGALLMTVLDVLIEPVAIRLDFWSWASKSVPLQNYIAWYALSFLLFLFFRRLNRTAGNRMAPVVLSVQYLFFTALNLAA